MRSMQITRGQFVTITLTALLLSTATGRFAQAQSAASVRVSRVRVEPFTNPSGRKFQMVYVDWKNTGSKPVSEVRASIRVLDAAGREIPGVGTGETIVFTKEDYAGKPIAAGKSFREPYGDGWVVVLLPGQSAAKRAVVKITRAK
jgi:hypothetical protein